MKNYESSNAEAIDVQSILSDLASSEPDATRRQLIRDVKVAVAELQEKAAAALEQFIESTKYEDEHDEIGLRVCCGVLSYQPHEPDCDAVRLSVALCNSNNGVMPK